MFHPEQTRFLRLRRGSAVQQFSPQAKQGDLPVADLRPLFGRLSGQGGLERIRFGEFGAFFINYLPPTSPPEILRREFSEGFMFCKSLCYKGFYVEIKKARTRGLDGRRNKNWGGGFRSEIQASP